MRRIERRSRRRAAAVACSFVLVLLCAVAASARQQPSALAGVWEGAHAGQQLALALKADGTGTLNGQPFTYVVRGRNLLAESGGEAYLYTFSLEGDRLTISGGVFGDAPVVFTRKGAAAGVDAPGGGGSGGRERQGGGGRAAAAGGGGLVGRWRSSGGEIVQVRDDGTLVLHGNATRYTVRGDTMTISGDGFSIDVSFKLAGDTLTTEYEGRTTVYKRIAESEDESAGGGATPRELVGKWCYQSNVNTGGGGRMSNLCFELRADGGYTYQGETSSSGPVASSASQDYDEGTWTATATTITAHSRSGRVTTYRLEKRNHPKTGDPMLLLDGDAFVTYYQRPPWP